ncbi:glycoside hydrolase family 1 protein [Spiroplasma culicicola]|uniref:6-phospho-beta-glucosidase n=1 Tax=Spiroplasma culicicola AES-1 TaxID=1276246 RepID=W6A6J0_9MOLU|nr:glycoside hydrolase family 1 protein [Spiroplasma culicicola]AHI52586.1 6-phospho-beta-glucosidase [Spiroplasma culicicola AES-1]
MSKIEKQFLIGASLSGPQTEGSIAKKIDSVMDYWYKNYQDDFYNHIGPEITSNFYVNYKEALKNLDKLGLEMYRTSIQWSRIFSDDNLSQINNEGIEFYKAYFKEIKKYNVRLVVNLFHFDMPMSLQKKDGFFDKLTINKYVEYAKICFENFNDLVDDWATFNEPMANVECQYLYGFHYPKEKNFKKSIQIFYNILVAHAKVVNLFNRDYRKDNQKITTILALNPAIPRDKNNLEDVKAAHYCDLLRNYAQLDPIINGNFDPELIVFLKENNFKIDFNKSELDEIACAKIDYISLNYYQPSRVKAKEQKVEVINDMHDLFDFWDWPEKRINPYRGWEIFPEGIYKIANVIKERYNNFAWVISENGMGVEDEERFRNKEGFIDDDYRIEFIQEHLEWIYKAIEEGSNCFGYNLWTFIDNWSWSNAYKNRYGFVEYNLETQKYILKKSGYWIKEVIKKKRGK